MQFEWDPEKAQSNRTKHGIDFVDAVEVLFDPLGLTLPDDDPTEVRYVTVGRDALSRTLVVVCTKRRMTIRIISARRATRREKSSYEENK